MKYDKIFLDLIDKSIRNKQYVGLGNPNANILIIGKEAGINPKDKEDSSLYHSNAEIWKTGSEQYMQAYQPEKDSKLCNGNHTWQKYQKLYDLIVGGNPHEKYYIDFVKNVFVTELSNLPYPNTKGAKEIVNFNSELSKRKTMFFNTPFIKKFPIIIIAALDNRYIMNFGEGDTREIDNIFEVSFEKECNCKNGKDKYWIHHSKNKSFPKLLVHTRQLTNGASNELIERIAILIKKFAEKNKIILKLNN